jgi:hypothetical protein
LAVKRALLFAILAIITTSARAGQDCRSEVIAPVAQAEAAAQALAVVGRLEAMDAPVALVARVGTDLSKHGLRYSHVGFVVRDAEDGRWTMIHLLNTCGTDRSALYAEGLVDYYADARVALDTAVVWLDAPLAEDVVRVLASRDAAHLHDADYNVIAHPHSAQYQNSTAWVLETLAIAMSRDASPDRARAQDWAAPIPELLDEIRAGRMVVIAGRRGPRERRRPDHGRVSGAARGHQLHGAPRRAA